jgi:predicted nucleic acid-binding protein
VLVAIALQQQSQLSVWDVMVIHAAAEAGADVLWTGDLSDRQVLHVRIRNPFADARENS